MACQTLHIRSREIGILTITLLLALLSPERAASVEYILARREEHVNAVCLGRSAEAAFAWDPSTDAAGPVPVDQGPVEWVGGGQVTNANFMYIGDQANLRDHTCASAVSILLYNRDRSQPFINLQGDQLPGSAGTISYVTPIWKAKTSTNVDLLLVNGASEAWQIISNLPDDPVVLPDTTVQAHVSGSFFNSSLQTLDMVQSFLTAAVGDTVRYPPGQTQAAIIMNEKDGSTAYLFFGVFPAWSSMCAEDAPTGISIDSFALKGTSSTCVKTHLFEAQYSIDGIDFESYTSYYSRLAASSRRLLQATQKHVRGSTFRVHRRSLADDSEADSVGSASLSGAVRSLVCYKLTTSESSCTEGSANYPGCATTCQLVSSASKK